MNTHGTGPGEVDVLANDTDIDGDPLTIISFQDLGGRVSCGGSKCTYRHPTNTAWRNGKFTYTVADGRGGVSKATVIVRVRVNNAPVANDDEGDAHGTGASSIPVLFNDLDDEGDLLTTEAVTPESVNGGTVGCGGGFCTYTAPEGFLGVDRFEYQIDDGHGGSDTAFVDVTVRANVGPTAIPDEAVAHGIGDFVIPVLANDLDPEADPLSIVAVGGNPIGGVICGSGCRYAPPTAHPPYPFSDTFTYTIDDGHGGPPSTTTVTVEVRANHAPLAVDDRLTAPSNEVGFGADGALPPLRNDVDPDGDRLDVTDWTNGSKGDVVCIPPDPGKPWTCHYVARPGAEGEDTFTYTITDNHGDCATEDPAAGECPQLTATVHVTITPNHDPVARDDYAFAHGTGAVPVPALENDTDSDGDALGIVSHTQPGPGLGTVSCGTGGCTYVPPSPYTGPLEATFTYTIGDGRGGESGATVHVKVAGEQRSGRPRRPGNRRASSGRPRSRFVENDYDPDGDKLMVVDFTPPRDTTRAASSASPPAASRAVPTALRPATSAPSASATRSRTATEAPRRRRSPSRSFRTGPRSRTRTR